MMLVFGLMLLLKTAACLDRFCWFNQSDPCYAALGNKLTLRDAKQYEVKIQKSINNNKSTDPICKVKDDKMKDCDLYSNRTDVEVINGTLIINPVIREDSGNYTVTFSDSSGSQTSTDLQVNVEAPIGSVDVSISCSSSGVMRASCSSDGDQILYSWTLNGGPRMDGDSSIDLDKGTDGNISCSVKNHVSHGQKPVRVKPCSGEGVKHESPRTSPGGSRVTLDSEYVLHVSLIALGCVALILILLFITVYHIYKKKQVKSTPAASAAGSVDIIYADISHKKKREMKKPESLMAADVEYVEIQPQKKRKVRKEKEDEVQYGEVTFTNNRASAHPRPQKECIYSQVHRC